MYYENLNLIKRQCKYFISKKQLKKLHKILDQLKRDYIEYVNACVELDYDNDMFKIFEMAGII